MQMKISELQSELRIFDLAFFIQYKFALEYLILWFLI
jgi:hypothetical protein